jgi:hypothetical protein
MQLTAKRGKKPARMKLFEVDKRRMAEVTEIFKLGAQVLIGEQADLCRLASEAIVKAQESLEANGKPPVEMPGQKSLLPDEGETSDETQNLAAGDPLQAVRDEAVSIAEGSPAEAAKPEDAPASGRRRK